MRRAHPSFSLKYAPMPNALPVRRWQLVQWQAEVRTGAAFTR
jgi:hypothetical protein